MLAHAEGRWRPLIVTAIFTGLRASELRGLQWSDVDLDARRINGSPACGPWGSIGSPKSDAGKRTIPLAPMVINALKEWRLACPRGTGRSSIPKRKGQPGTDYLDPLSRPGADATAAGITEPTSRNTACTALRHAAASLFIEQGFQPEASASAHGPFDYPDDIRYLRPPVPGGRG